MKLSKKRGFTLIEILVAILIVGILATVALPQYQKAVLKSRYSALMPIARKLADSNEVYYMEHGNYASDPAEMPVQGQAEYPVGTHLAFGPSARYAYVLASNADKIPHNTYVVYQKHSGQYAGEIHCEADAHNANAQAVCESFGATENIGETITPHYVTYVLMGTGNGVPPARCMEGATCDEEGNITECSSGLTLNNGACVECDIANASACSTTAYEATACNTGYEVDNGVCEEIPTCTGPQPATKAACDKGYSGTKTGTVSCQSGQWVVEWNMSTCVEADGTGIYSTNSSSASPGQQGHCIASTIETCSGESAFYNAKCSANEEGTCIGNTYGYGASCVANAEYTCSGGTYNYSAVPSKCQGIADNSCSGNNTFTGGTCIASGENACNNNEFIYSEAASTCKGQGVNSCSNNLYKSMAGGYYACTATANGACSNSTFDRASCKADAPGTCLNNTYINGAKCSGRYCPAGSPKGTVSGKPTCWDGNGNSGPQYCE